MIDNDERRRVAKGLRDWSVTFNKAVFLGGGQRSPAEIRERLAELIDPGEETADARAAVAKDYGLTVEEVGYALRKAKEQASVTTCDADTVDETRDDPAYPVDYAALLALADDIDRMGGDAELACEYFGIARDAESCAGCRAHHGEEIHMTDECFRAAIADISRRIREACGTGEAASELGKPTSQAASQVRTLQDGAAAALLEIADEMEDGLIGHEGWPEAPAAKWAHRIREICGDGKSVGKVVVQIDVDAESVERVAGELREREERIEELARENVELAGENEKLTGRIAELESDVECYLDKYTDAYLRKNRLFLRVRSWEEFALAALDRISAMESPLWVPYGERIEHTKPEVLGADGVPIHVGDTVYNVETGDELTVTCTEGGRVNAMSARADVPGCLDFDGAMFTHTPPDTWDELEAVADLLDNDLEGMPVHDLFMRCKKLAGVES